MIRGLEMGFLAHYQHYVDLQGHTHRLGQKPTLGPEIGI